MREIRQSGSEGGARFNPLSLPLSNTVLSPISAIHIREEVVSPLDLLQPFRIGLGSGELLVNPGEAQQMLLHTLARIVGAGSRPQDEWPVAGLGEQQLARGLLEHALLQVIGLWESPRQFGHAVLGDAQVRVNPFVLLVEPDAPIAFFAPA